MNHTKEIYQNTEEACNILNIHPNTLRRLAKQNKIDYFTINKDRRYNVNKYIDNNLKQAV